MNNENTVSIRLATADDTDNIVKWRNMPHVVNNFIMRTPLTRQMHEGWIESRIKTGKAVQFIIVADGSEIGSVYLRDIDHQENTAEFGIFIGEINALSKGYGTKAQKLILDYAFNELNLETVSLRVLSENKMAINSYKKNGFELIPGKVETEIIDGMPVEVIFMLVKKDK